MNPVLTLTHNNLELTKKCVASLYEQNVRTTIRIIDNGSTDGTVQWVDNNAYLDARFLYNRGVSSGWNLGLEIIFSQFPHCLVVGNDTILPPWFYDELLSYEAPFVTGVAFDTMDAIKQRAPQMPLQPCPDFSAFLIRRDTWYQVGKFDEGMKFYASDVDYHIRAAKLGISLMKANVPYFHAGSSTLRNAPPEERAEIERQADADRAYFQKKWGFKVGSPEHHQSVGFEVKPC